MAEETEGISNGEMNMDPFDQKSSAEVSTVQTVSCNALCFLLRRDDPPKTHHQT